jgi:phage RecT family recombinase
MSDKLATIDQSAQGYLASIGKQLSKYAPENSDMGDFFRSVQLAIVDNPELQKCLDSDSGKRSLYNALKYAASTGLSLNPLESKAALIGYGGKIQYQVMKAGMIQLAQESGKVEFITADTVRENDRFELVKTPEGDRYEYSPARKNRGDIDGYFACVKIAEGVGRKAQTHILYMSSEEVEVHKSKFSSKTKMPIEGYGLKTVLKKCLRNLHISPEISKAVGADDSSEHAEPVAGSAVVLEKLEAKKQQAEQDNDVI